MRRKTPQQKKQDDYEQQIRPDIEAPHAFRRNWPKKRARTNRKTRKKVEALIQEAAKSGDFQGVTAAAAKTVRKGRDIQKQLVRTLREKVTRQAATRSAREKSGRS